MARKIIRIFLLILLFIIVSILSQIGSILLLLAILLARLIIPLRIKPRYRISGRILLILLIYTTLSITIIPPLAKLNNRVPLPVMATQEVPLKPAMYLSVLLHRHYVRPELRESTIEHSKKIAKVFPGTQLIYLDANFPFWNGFPLFPHLSHNDGKKLDLAFCYRDEKGQILNQSPTWWGYGFVEGPRKTEHDQTRVCLEKGYWQYDITRRLSWQSRKAIFDKKRTRYLIKLWLGDKLTGKIFLEPHLKSRLNLSNESRIRFHGCRAVRHDDHIHIQM